MMPSTCLDPKLGALLHAYDLRALSEGDAAAFETHLLACDYCFEAVRSFEPYAALLCGDEAVQDELRRALSEVLPPSAGTRPNRALWPRDLPLFLRPAILILIILALIYPAWRGVRPPAATAIRATQSIYLMPTRSGSTAVLTASRGQDGIISFVYSGAAPGRRYDVVISFLDGSNAHFKTQVEFDSDGIGQLLFPARLMRPGTYQLEINDPNKSSGGGTQVYRFRVNP